MGEMEKETSIAGKVVTVLGALKMYKYGEREVLTILGYLSWA